jgi:hypothetical protein
MSQEKPTERDMHIKTVNGWRRLEVYCPEPEGVFRAQSIEVVRKELDKRARDFCTLMLDNDAGSWNRPLFGAFGERL